MRGKNTKRIKLEIKKGMSPTQCRAHYYRGILLYDIFLCIADNDAFVAAAYALALHVVN